jgi:hypothetical protein
MCASRNMERRWNEEGYLPQGGTFFTDDCDSASTLGNVMQSECGTAPCLEVFEDHHDYITNIRGCQQSILGVNSGLASAHCESGQQDIPLPATKDTWAMKLKRFLAGFPEAPAPTPAFQQLIICNTTLCNADVGKAQTCNQNVKTSTCNKCFAQGTNCTGATCTGNWCSAHKMTYDQNFTAVTDDCQPINVRGAAYCRNINETFNGRHLFGTECYCTGNMCNV